MNLIFIIPQWCDPIKDRWFDATWYTSPFWIFCIGFGIALVWSVIELIVHYLNGGLDSFKVVVLSAVLVFSGAGCFAQLNNWHMMKIQDGELTYKDYWYLFIDQRHFERTLDFRPMLREADPNEPPQYQAYIREHSCNAGKEVWQLDREVFDNYYRMWDEYYHNIDKEEVKRGLYEKFKIESG